MLWYIVTSLAIAILNIATMVWIRIRCKGRHTSLDRTFKGGDNLLENARRHRHPTLATASLLIVSLLANVILWPIVVVYNVKALKELEESAE